jgi:hypothetical protein
MTDERFNQLLNGPLSHPLIPLRISRLAMALRDVVETVPGAASRLEAHCLEREAQDHRQDATYDDGPVEES